MTVPLRLPPLDEPMRVELCRRYEERSDAETRTRYQMLLFALAGRTSTQIADLVCRSQDTVARVLKQFLQGGLEAVPHGFGLVDWRDGWFDGRIAPGRTADVFGEQVRAAVVRSQKRGRVGKCRGRNSIGRCAGLGGRKWKLLSPDIHRLRYHRTALIRLVEGHRAGP